MSIPKSNLVGMRFDRLIVVAQSDSEHNRTRWICDCDCGRRIITTRTSLQQGKKKSCGCLRSDMCRERAAINTSNRTLPGDAGSFNQLYASYKWQAAKRGLSFELSKDDFRRLVSGTCVYCGALPSQRYRARPTTENFIYNGVDRVNNATGYTIENSVSCCGICNDMKRHRSKEEFLEQCSAITEYMNFKMQAEMSCGGQMAD